jgi:hypothetical protein
MAPERHCYLAELPDGSQVMVEEWVSEAGECVHRTAAVRAERHHVWGPPRTLRPATQ